MATPRPVRIPRARGPTSPTLSGPVEHRRNAAGTQRAFRLAGLYLLALIALDLVLVAFDLSSSEAGRPAVVAGLQLFLGVAAVLAVVGVLFALTPAPRAVTLRADQLVVVGRWGSSRVFPPVSEQGPQVLRRFSAGLLSTRPVEMVRLTDRRGRRATYQIEAGLLELRGDPFGVP
jgi:hypothetical protein